MRQEAVSATVAARLQAARKSRNMTAQALADAITARGYAVSRTVIAKVEGGIRETIPVDLVVHAAQVLHVPVLRLLTDGPWCACCNDTPPGGFSCLACGATAEGGADA
ncbi:MULTISPECIES: helix-turn-helix domain-containing protein [Streptomyces]|uniref:HTH cro/C1-type domain-containing protein n=2 Tax=Streptomyces TaxID=1883 RepID=A0A1E7LK22_9ACTN|nr:helix-turn-helix domain-containing protein [Streptomyces nanshensis]OEV16283.1 hypothetical protein AN221_32230 [Streptomyces nanshensis]